MNFSYYNRTDPKSEGWAGKQASIWDADNANGDTITGTIVVDCPRNGTDADMRVQIACLDQDEAEAIAEFLLARAIETRAAAIAFRDQQRIANATAAAHRASLDPAANL